MIWRELLVSDEPVDPKWRKRFIPTETRYLRMHNIRSQFRQQRKITVMMPAFTCRAIYQEAIAIYYSENSFRFPIIFPDDVEPSLIQAHISSHGWSLVYPEFANAIGRNIDLIRKVEIDFMVYSRDPWYGEPEHWQSTSWDVFQSTLLAVQASLHDGTEIEFDAGDEDLWPYIEAQARQALSPEYTPQASRSEEEKARIVEEKRDFRLWRHEGHL